MLKKMVWIEIFMILIFHLCTNMTITERFIVNSKVYEHKIKYDILNQHVFFSSYLTFIDSGITVLRIFDL